METVYHKAESRGHAYHGWLNTYHTFSFAQYHNPNRMGFGALRVLNDDTVRGGMGFGRHPHQNMEIISIPLVGALKHEDSMGNSGTITQGEVQVMSAGSGIQHSEKNASMTDEVQFLQIWIIPNKEDVGPRYDQIKLSENWGADTFNQIVSPNPDDAGTWIHQDSWFHLGHFQGASTQTHTLNREGNGLYIFVIEGELTTAGQLLKRRDGLCITDTDQFVMEINPGSEILLMEVPLRP